MDASYAPKPAAAIAARLAQVEGVIAVALGGSHARGTADAESDLDLGLYYRRDQPPVREALDALARELDDRHASGLVTGIGEWGPWIDGGAWLEVAGGRVDWLYRDLDRVDEVIADCEAGRVTCTYQPGHPHGFHNHMYMAEVHHAIVLEDGSGELAAIRARTAVYPEALRAALIDRHGWEARFTSGLAYKAAGRGDAVYVAGTAFRSIACLVQVLFALNRRWFVNEKGSVAEAARFPLAPIELAERATSVLGGSRRLRDRVELLDGLVADVEQLAIGA